MLRRSFCAFLIVVLAMASYSVVSLRGRAQSTETITEINLSLVDIRFEPDEITITGDVDVTFHLSNDGVAPHSFDIDELDIHEELAAGQSTDIVVNAAPGEYEFYCAIPGHTQAGMVGVLTVEDVTAPAPTSTRAEEADTISQLEDRLAELETRVAILETAIAQQGTAPTVASPIVETGTSDGTRESPAAVGETVERDGVAITLLDAQIVQPSSFSEPDPGMTYLGLDLRIENNSDNPVEYGDSHVSVKDVQQGFEFEDTFPTYLAPLPLQSGDLTPGDFVRGTVIVVVSETSTQLLVRYTTDPYGEGDEFFWQVSLS